MNFRLLVQYDGTNFHGWQIQNGLRTVQGELTRVLSLLDSRDVHVHGSGRTDAGVHAEGQVANVQLVRDILPEKLRNAINGRVTAPDSAAGILPELAIHHRPAKPTTSVLRHPSTLQNTFGS